MARPRSVYFGSEQKARIEIIPMIDIMMFLLVFFMVITLRMIEGAGIAMELPRSDSAQKLAPARFTVGVARDGTLSLQGVVVPEDQLTARLRAAGEQVKVDVLIAGDKDTPYQRIIHAMDLVRAAGIDAVALTTSMP